MLTHTQKSKITHLALTGCIDARDFKWLRDEFCKLMELDLANSNINAYEGIDGTCEHFNSYKANEIPIYSFYNCYTGISDKSLIHITLSRSFSSVSDDIFFGCNNVKVDEIKAAIS